jgi:sugar/nucleoside kinase (ribokinase family)
MERATPHYLVLGRLTRDYVLLPSGEPLLDIPGGSVLYAAVGLAIWEPQPPPALVARVGEDYPQDWLDNFQQHGLNVQGVRVLPEAVDLRTFTAIVNHTTRTFDDPVAHFARLGLPFPKALLGYRAPQGLGMDSRTRLLPVSLRQADIPEALMDANAAHLCPLDYLTHSLMPALLRQAEFTTLTLDPSPGYMNPAYWGDVPALLTGLTAFLPSEDELRSLFQSRSNDPWEMAEALSAYGCEIIVIKCGERGQLLYDAATHSRWEIPPYPARFSNPIGAGDAFCGGFLAGYRRTYDPLQAVMYGNISASLVVEGNLPTYALGALPGLQEARLEALRQLVRKV